MSGKEWLDLGATSNVISDTQFFEGKSRFSFRLTMKRRLYLFVLCLASGFALSLLAISCLIIGWLSGFATLYALGTITSLLGTGFLMGFTSQLKMMFKPVRIVATTVLLCSIAFIFVGAFYIKNDSLCIFFVVLEYLAYMWYALSYIPFVKKLVGRMFGF